MNVWALNTWRIHSQSFCEGNVFPLDLSMHLSTSPHANPHPPSDVANDLLPVESNDDVRILKSLIQRHIKFTGSDVARGILLNWERERTKFKKVFPSEYK